MERSAFIKAAVLCLFLVVCLRSFVGMTLAFPWKGQAHWGVALICAVVFGKALGGVVCDKIGAFAASALSLSISALLFMFSSIPLAGIAAVFFFNMTMPITLFAITRIFHNAKGFSFGMLTFALFLGFLPSYMGFDSSAFSQYVFALASILSLALLLLGLKGARL